VKQQARKELIHRAATVATLSDNSLKKHPQPNKSQDIFGMPTPVVQRSVTVEVHKLGCKAHVAGCKPDSAVSGLANSLVNGSMDEALAIPANSQHSFGLLPPCSLSQSNIHPENLSQAKIREKSMRHKTDAVLAKPSSSQGTSGSEYRDDLSQCKPHSMLSLPENSHEICEPLDKDAEENGNIKNMSRPSTSSSIAVSSYSLLELHLSRVNSLGEFKTENIDCLSPTDTSLPINSVNECKSLEKGDLFKRPLEDAIHQNNSCDTCREDRNMDDVSTPVLPDHSMEEQVLVDMDTDNLCESSCIPTSSSDGYAQASLAMPEHLNSPNEDMPSEEDAARTPVHVTRFLSNRVHSRSGYKPRSYNEPSVSDVRTEHVDLYQNNSDQHDRSMSPPEGTSGMKNLSTVMTDEGSAMYQEVKEMAHSTAATHDFEGGKDLLLLAIAAPLLC
jgi:hypothetical protein